MALFTKLLARRIAEMLKGHIPTQSVGTVNSKHEPPSMALNMDVERILAVVAAAEGGYTRDLFALYRDVVVVDSHLQTEWSKRKMSVLGDTLNVLPYDKTNKDDVITADLVSAEISDCKSWKAACAFALDSTLYPVSVIEKVFIASGSQYRIKELRPVQHHLLDFRTGRMMIHDVDPDTGIVLPTTRFPDPARYIVHRGHLLTCPDNWGGPMRSILFWWLLSAMDREWWSRFLEKYGSPFLVGKFADDEGRGILERAFSLAVRIGGLVISRDTDVELQKTAASDSGDAYDKFLTICQREKSKLVLGQTLSSEAQPGGLGGGAANLQSDVRDDISRFDAVTLADTMKHQLITQLCQINNLPGRPPKLTWGSQSKNDTRNTAALLQSFAQANLELTDAGIASMSESLGISLQRRASATANPVPFSISLPHTVDVSSVIPEIRRPLATLSRIVSASASKDDCLAKASMIS